MERFTSYKAIPATVRHQMVIMAEENGLDPVMVMAGIKAAYTKRNNSIIGTAIRVHDYQKLRDNKQMKIEGQKAKKVVITISYE
jgi:hypothetical protein